MKLSRLRGTGLHNNSIFNIDSPQNRDNCFAPYVRLKESLKSYGIQLDTSDINADDEISFELHQDVQNESSSQVKYLLLFETAHIKPENGNPENYKKYRKIFTWNDDLVDGKNYIKINFPNEIQIHTPDGFSSRTQFCCLISSNRALLTPDSRDLYSERVKAIRWFEKNAPEDFSLYGIGWDIPAAKNGIIGKIERRLWLALNRIFKMQHFPSYQGKVSSKKDVLVKTRFSICYENVRDLQGYITEKIFDCFFSGCIPVYWGANNVSQHIPSDCFIDRRDFSNMAELHSFLHSMSESEFVGYQKRIASFLNSDAVYPFGSDFFAETIAKTIAKDLGI
ncbi:hypothetical protein CW358_24295 [Pseudomonas protegens]|uniref:glycosyltransferase family 10 domain-containing protein n=1 Tax=Pseudomonas protegens TaxID=380021 RepID=UPI0010115569|nr:glycosyltransferase family 10 [Pseudomonas protegens]RXU61976.1 hypothetical protein CW358_24295 [Pseudomonas protegens]